MFAIFCCYFSWSVVCIKTTNDRSAVFLVLVEVVVVGVTLFL